MKLSDFQTERMRVFLTWMMLPSFILGLVLVRMAANYAWEHQHARRAEGAKFYENAELNGPMSNAGSELVISTLQQEYIMQLPSSDPAEKYAAGPRPDGYAGHTSAVVRQLLNNQRDGFYVESLSHTRDSNTLGLETELGWSGLLIEADPQRVARLVATRRHGVVSPTCLSATPYPMMESLDQRPGNSAAVSVRQQGPMVQCFPLTSYLLALNQHTVDYLSLEVEGRGFEALEYVSFTKVDIHTISVSVRPDQQDKDKWIVFMENKGYIHWGELDIQGNTSTKDWIFYKKM